MYILNLFYSAATIATAPESIKEYVDIRREIGVEMLQDAIEKLKPMKRVCKTESDDNFELKLQETIRRLKPVAPVYSR